MSSKEANNDRSGLQQQVEIVEYDSRYFDAFRTLNIEWITAHWELEASDYRVLDDPQGQIIDKGGHIFVGLYNGEAVGVCALVKGSVEGYDYEIAKYTVSPKAQGKGIGYRLCQTAVDAAFALGGRSIFIESNTILHPALHIYDKLGFKEIPCVHPAHSRGDILLELRL